MSNLHLPPIYFLRHGETFFNAEGRIQGQLDTDLSPLGRHQAAEAGRTLGAALRTAGLDSAAPFYVASPLSRASETMRLARSEIGLAADGFTQDRRLMELSFGQWQNLTWPEIKQNDPRGFAARAKDTWNYTPADGESYATLQERVRPWLDALDRPTVAVAHGGVARALMVLAGGLTSTEAYTMPVYQGRVLLFSGGKGAWI